MSRTDQEREAIIASMVAELQETGTQARGLLAELHASFLEDLVEDRDRELVEGVAR